MKKMKTLEEMEEAYLSIQDRRRREAKRLEVLYDI